MGEDSSEHESFINRKRPAMEGLIEHLIGPTTLMDQVMGGKPDFPSRKNEFEPDADKLLKQEKSEGSIKDL
ncbi:MAG TPA: hypothetical protein DDW50_08460 [Firmicutes bacterium]|nr:hypothetical protein [Bacillota bacterium]